MGRNKNVTTKEAVGAVVGVSAISQLSNNKNIRNAGQTLGIFAIMVYLGEGIKWLLKYIIWKPCVFIAKGFGKLFWFTAKVIYYYPIKGIIKLIENIRTKKTIE